MSRALKVAAGIALISTMVACGGDPDSVPEAATPVFKIGAATGVIEGGRVVIDARGETCKNINSMTIEIQAENSSVSPEPSAARSYTQAVTFTISDIAGNSRTYSVEVLVKNCNTAGTSSSAKSPSAAAPAAPSTTEEPADRYVGVWDSGCQTDGESSGVLRATFAKTGSNSYSGTLESTTYNTTNCSGPVDKNDRLTGIGANIVGTKSVGANTVDKIMLTSSEVLAKVIALCDGKTLQFGGDDDDVDGEGYPNALFFLVMNKI
jgi:hypothetical protein